MRHGVFGVLVTISAWGLVDARLAAADSPPHIQPRLAPFHRAIQIPAAGAETLSVTNRMGQVLITAWDRAEIQVRAVKYAPTAELGERLRVEVQSPDGRRISVRTYVRVRPPLSARASAALGRVLREQADLLEHVGKGAAANARVRQRITELQRELEQLGREAHDGGPLEAPPDFSLPVSDGRVDLVLHVPRRLSLVARTFKHRLAVKGVWGDLQLSSEEGALHVRDIRGSVTTWGRRGSQRLERVRGTVRVRAGEADLQLRQLQGDVDAEVARGAIEARRINARRVALRTVHGDIRLGLAALPQGASVSLLSHAGALRVFEAHKQRRGLRLTGRAARWDLDGLQMPRIRQQGNDLQAESGRGEGPALRLSTRLGSVGVYR